MFFDSPFVLMQSWIVILYSVRDLCVHYPEFDAALGYEFSELCEELGASSDRKKWIFLRRTIVPPCKDFLDIDRQGL